ncbi:MAG: hypothetical protein ACTSO9_19365 [Candidatus Helarchaeota archaeon]
MGIISLFNKIHKSFELQIYFLMLPKLNKEEILLLELIQKGIPKKKIQKKFKNFYYIRNKLFKNLNIKSDLYINFEMLGLTNYIILSKYQLSSPYLVESYNYYLSSEKVLSRLCISDFYEKELINIVLRLDPEAIIFRAQEIIRPTFNFKPFRHEFDEFGLWNFVNHFRNYDMPEVKISTNEKIEFDKKILDFLYYKSQGFSINKIFEIPGFSKKIYYNIEKKIKNVLYLEILDISLIQKILIILNFADINLENPNRIISAINEFFIYCNCFEIEEISINKAQRIKKGILCILTPPTIEIPFFNYVMHEFLKIKYKFYFLSDHQKYFNFNQAFESGRKDWVWNSRIIKIR